MVSCEPVRAGRTIFASLIELQSPDKKNAIGNIRFAIADLSLQDSPSGVVG
jgi:hypothetical protein